MKHIINAFKHIQLHYILQHITAYYILPLSHNVDKILWRHSLLRLSMPRHILKYHSDTQHTLLCYLEATDWCTYTWTIAYCMSILTLSLSFCSRVSTYHPIWSCDLITYCPRPILYLPYLFQIFYLYLYHIIPYAHDTFVSLLLLLLIDCNNVTFGGFESMRCVAKRPLCYKLEDAGRWKVDLDLYGVGEEICKWNHVDAVVIDGEWGERMTFCGHFYTCCFENDSTFENVQSSLQLTTAPCHWIVYEGVQALDTTISMVGIVNTIVFGMAYFGWKTRNKK